MTAFLEGQESVAVSNSVSSGVVGLGVSPGRGVVVVGGAVVAVVTSPKEKRKGCK